MEGSESALSNAWPKGLLPNVHACPSLDSDISRQAFDLLSNSPMLAGRARDRLGGGCGRFLSGLVSSEGPRDGVIPSKVQKRSPGEGGGRFLEDTDPNIVIAGVQSETLLAEMEADSRLAAVEE